MSIKDIATTLENYNIGENPQIAIVGFHKAGKSTLAKKIADTLKIRYVPEFARDLLKVTNYNWKDDFSYVTPFERAIFSCVYFTHKFLSETDQGFVADRSLVDITAYCLWHMLKHDVVNNTCIDDFPEYHDLLLFYKKLLQVLPESSFWYNVILYYRPDGVEIDSCQRFIDAAIGELLGRYFKDTPIFEIRRGDELRFGENLIITV